MSESPNPTPADLIKAYYDNLRSAGPISPEVAKDIGYTTLDGLHNAIKQLPPRPPEDNTEYSSSPPPERRRYFTEAQRRRNLKQVRQIRESLIRPKE